MTRSSTRRVLARSGASGATHRAVAAEAGASVTLTTYHVASLNELLAAMWSASMEEHLARLADAAAARRERTSLVDVDARSIATAVIGFALLAVSQVDHIDDAAIPSLLDDLLTH